MPNVDREIPCGICHKIFVAHSNGAKYCPDCQPERTRPIRKVSTHGKYVIVGYDCEKVQPREADEIIPLKGRLMNREMLNDLLVGMPAGVFIQKNNRRFVTTPDRRLQEIT